jgi:small GTP-binding protein
MGCGGSKGKNKNRASGIQIRDPNKNNQKLEAKIVLVGSSGVGKTCIATRYKEGKFTNDHKITVGAAYFQKNFGFPDGSQLKLHIWDTGGQEKFKSVAPLYYKDAHAALIVYGIDDESTFQAVDTWTQQLDEHGNMPRMVKFLIGNKSDIEKERRKVQMKDGMTYAKNRKMPFYETSALLNDGSINDVFSNLATEIKKAFSETELTANV